MRCKERSGFLFAHGCDRLVASQCSRCSKPVCTDHLRPGGVCVSCEKRASAAASSRGSRGSRSSRHYNDPYWYGYGYYDNYHYYDEQDHRVFDPQAEPAETYEDDFDGS